MPNIKMNSWMQELKDGRRLVDLTLPASHDAGVYTDLTSGVNPGSTARCQYSNFWKQAEAGSRVFDVRCFLRTTGIIEKTRTPTMGHFFIEGKDGRIGEYGGTLLSALDDACSFVNVFPSEFLIFRIGHTKCTGDVAQVLQKFKTENKNGGRLYTGATGNLAHLAVGDLRGKLLLVFDKEFNSPSYKPQDGYYLYFKYPSISQTGLTFCGKYSGGLGKKFALKSEDKGNWSPEGAVKLAQAACDDHLNHSQDDHLLWVYWQETGGNVEKNTTATDGMYAKLDLFLSTFRIPSNKTGLPNVIGHDFVNEVTCTKIAKLNPDLANKL